MGTVAVDLVIHGNHRVVLAAWLPRGDVVGVQCSQDAAKFVHDPVDRAAINFVLVANLRMDNHFTSDRITNGILAEFELA